MQNEKLLSLNEAAAILPEVRGKRICISTIFRWCLRGLHGVKLEHRRFGRRLFTSREALDRFGAALASAGPAPRRGRATNKDRSDAQAERDLERAEAELKAAGI